MAEIGPENTPAYRYRCYVVGHQVDLGVTGRVPNYTFEVYQGDAGATATPLIALARDPGTGDLRTLDQATRLRGRNPATLAPTAPNVLLDPDKPLLWRGGVALGISPAHITWAATSDAYALWRVTEAGDVTSFPVGFSLIGNLVFVGETVFTGGFHYDNEWGGYPGLPGPTESVHPGGDAAGHGPAPRGGLRSVLAPDPQ
jgi:hypothetical protein